MADGKSIVTVQKDTTVSLWDTTTGAMAYFKDGTEGKGSWGEVKDGELFGIWGCGTLKPLGKNMLVGILQPYLYSRQSGTEHV